jgi:hypothetical protein
MKAFWIGLPGAMYCHFHLGPIRPLQDRGAGELAAIVADDHSELATLLDDPVQLTSNPKAAERCIGDEAQAFSGAIIDDRQHSEPAAIGELIRHEVQRPAIIGSHRDQHRRSRANRSLAAAALAHRQLLLLIEPEELLVVYTVPFAFEQHVDASITEAAAFMRQRLHPLAKIKVIAAPGFVTNRLAREVPEAMNPRRIAINQQDAIAHTEPAQIESQQAA